jgi:23S rRNA (pseudouridine1915-N3)-methyltransferase
VRVHVVAVGKLRDRALRGVFDDYAGRIRRYTRFDETELRDGPDEAVVERFWRATGGAMAPGSGGRVQRVALEVDGVAWSSQRFARFVGEAEDDGSVDELAFLIGGSHGLPAAISTAANLRWSLGPLTLPHRLCRVVLAEQVYRAFTILRGAPYDH